MTEQGMRFRLGVFVLISGVLLAVLVLLFARLPAVFRQHAEYFIIFDYAPGVAPGTPVRRSGVRIGQVQAVDLDSATGKVRVSILVEKPHVLFEDDQPVLVKGLLGGDVSIDFQQVGVRPPAEPVPVPLPPPGPPQAGVVPAGFQVALQPGQPQPQPPPRVPAQPGKTFQGTAQSDISGVVRRLDEITPVMEETLRAFRDLAKASRDVIPNLQRTSDEARLTIVNWGRLGERLDVLVQANQDKVVKTLDNLNEALGQAAKIFNEENQRNLAATLRNVREGTDNLGSLSKNADELVKSSRGVVERVQKSVEQADQVLANLQQATKPMAERSDKIMKNLDASVENLNATLTEARELLRSFGRGDGSAQRFLSDPALYQNLNDAAFMLTRLMPRVERILRDVEVFADKIARHPESLGVRGAVSPSSGLKEGPSAGIGPPRPGH